MSAYSVHYKKSKIKEYENENAKDKNSFVKVLK